jgi:HAD superfamily hydrolase (TIGR01509 family)
VIVIIKNIVFDLGNVLISFKPDKYMESFNFEKSIRDRVFESVFKSKYWLELDKGTLTEEEASELFCKSGQETKEEIKRVMSSWKDMLQPIPETIEILKELKQMGYRIYVLSNYHKNAFEKTSMENEFFKLLNGRIISYEVNCIKPEKEIYDKLLKAFNLEAGETLFIDDMNENIQGAENLGIQTILFKDAVQLRGRLMELNVI